MNSKVNLQKQERRNEMTIVSGKNTYVDEAQKAEHEIMIENLEKYLKALQEFNCFCCSFKLNFLRKDDYYPHTTDSSTISKFIQHSERKCKIWALIEPLKFEKDAL